MELKPAHETMLNQIKHHSSQLEVLDRIIADGPPTHTGSSSEIPSGSFHMGKCQEIGGLCSLLEVLQKTFIPLDKLDGVIEGLAGIRYQHAGIFVTIGRLNERKAPAQSVAQ